ncbi:MAG: NIPSNAP family protein [Chloroflexi bacterium]|nr:NIPSNAP family protein [Chloroflexota bacterium]
MIYEKRAYYAVPGKMPLVYKRFEEHALRLFERHGIRVVGFWEAYFGQSNILHYMLAFDDLATREEQWSAFVADPDWVKARAETEANGPLIDHIVVEIWKPTYFSPMP